MNRYNVKSIIVLANSKEELVADLAKNLKAIVKVAIMEGEKIKSSQFINEGESHVNYLSKYRGFQLVTGEKIEIPMHNFIVAYTHKDERKEKIDCALKVYHEWLSLEEGALVELFGLTPWEASDLAVSPFK